MLELNNSLFHSFIINNIILYKTNNSKNMILIIHFKIWLCKQVLRWWIQIAFLVIVNQFEESSSNCSWHSQDNSL